MGRRAERRVQPQEPVSFLMVRRVVVLELLYGIGSLHFICDKFVGLISFICFFFFEGKAVLGRCSDYEAFVCLALSV